MSQKEVPQLLTAAAVAQRSIRDRVGVWVEAKNAYDIVTRIRKAEEAGVRQIWGQNAGFTDVITAFAAAVTQTKHIRLGSAIVPSYSQHPLKLAQQALALHDLAPGRLRLGVGTGNPILIQELYGIPQPSPLAHLKEYVEIMRGFLWENATGYQGKFFHLRNDNIVAPIIAQTLRTAQIPLLISAVGPKAFRLAGEVSDGAISYVSPIPYLLDQALPALQAGAKAAQRPAPPLIAHITIALSTDERAVLATKRKRIQMAIPVGPYARMFALAGFAEALNGDEQALDALAQSLVISGDEATLRSKIKELLDSGLDELMLQLLPITDEESERKRLFQLVGSL
ncbi:LLM class F420-dependent oxidoreductase [Reticulibacter mediterranei]|uniref:LLM class F420-dependent oxidoreductase n=1 Tax=Reticulibacter mediterranei TaxID=2778369 RepID=A0A8J3N4N6_9CHLR|nr:LLM class flavin-dependent oxidoreductase [Reticulibacter mediterranei]GHO95530.1 LLM class F420-dependent oxidoreductase [Reticulibacter mediterranei]